MKIPAERLQIGDVFENRLFDRGEDQIVPGTVYETVLEKNGPSEDDNSVLLTTDYSVWYVDGEVEFEVIHFGTTN